MDLKSLVKYMFLSSIDKSQDFLSGEKGGVSSIGVIQHYRSNLTVEDTLDEMNDLPIYFCMYLEGMGRTADILYDLKGINL